MGGHKGLAGVVDINMPMGGMQMSPLAFIPIHGRQGGSEAPTTTRLFVTVWAMLFPC